MCMYIYRYLYRHKYINIRKKTQIKIKYSLQRMSKLYVHKLKVIKALLIVDVVENSPCNEVIDNEILEIFSSTCLS